MTTGTEAAETAQARLVAALAPVACITDRASVKLKSRDFYWYSPILKAQLRDMTADVVAVSRDEAEVIHVARSCAALACRSPYAAPAPATTARRCRSSAAWCWR
jgi:hypothetical protein